MKSVKLNLIFQKSDPRDLKYTSYLTKVPDVVDLTATGSVPPVYDQGQFGTCTANSAGWLLNYLIGRGSGIKFTASRMFVYANARTLDGTPLTEDTGTTLRSTFKSIDKFRTLDESKYAYSAANLTHKPPNLDYAIALTHKKFVYMSVPQTLHGLQTCLANGFPVSFGVEVYTSFMENACINTGIVPMPDTEKERIEGGHAILLVGYDNADKTFLFLNSWGTEVGLPNKRGFFKIPYDYVLDPQLANDFWTAHLFM